jgi:VIT1/CCC1 family predicted Fe2+/Mn2+ transporter
MSLFTGRSAVYSALRMAGIGAVAGALTYSIGRLFDVTLG